MAASYDVSLDIHSPYRATVILRESERAPDLSQTGDVIITYRHAEKRVTVKTGGTSDTETAAHVGDGEERLVRSLCHPILPLTSKSTGFSNANIGMLASVINTAAEMLAISCHSLSHPIKVDAVFRGGSTYGNLLKVIIADTRIFIPPINPRVVAKTELSLYATEKIMPGTIFCFLRQEPALEEDPEENFILSARNTCVKFSPS